MSHDLDNWLNSHHVFLLDAFGVLYSAMGALPGVVQMVNHWLEANKTVIVVTNNTSRSPDYIAQHLTHLGIPLNAKHIISSGRGLHWHKPYRQLIYKRPVLVIGSLGSHRYITDAGGYCVDTLEDAQAIVLAMSTPNDTARYEAIATHHQTHPDIPIICINPDHYVQTGNQKSTVIGHYAAKLASKLTRPMHWMGKPHPIFSSVVRDYIASEFNLTPDNSWLFVDDNPDNVAQLTQDLGIHGLIPKHTGLAQSWPTSLTPTATVKLSDTWGY